ncbi:hypothetical protein J4727_16895 [Providencia rettgeri]|uniref:Uncharacterized protein n=1 Tax=Providencia rettgeri TaxID=587 RepID=A0A939SR28_PRORE|nr:hypothetical protein [Providencia rettgeri]
MISTHKTGKQVLSVQLTESHLLGMVLIAVIMPVGQFSKEFTYAGGLNHGIKVPTKTSYELLTSATLTGDLVDLIKEIACNGDPELTRFISTLSILASEHCGQLITDINQIDLNATGKRLNHGDIYDAVIRNDLHNLNTDELKEVMAIQRKPHKV